MAQFLRRPWLLIATSLAVTVCIVQAGLTTVVLRSQEDPILEGNNVTLECLTDEGEDLSGYTFQKYNKWLQTWISLDKTHEMRCWFFGVTVNRENGRLLLAISDLKSWHTGRYRCIDSNSTSNESVSDELNLQMEYLHRIIFAQTNSWCGTVGDSITVLEGGNLELQCSADASKTPLYEWSREDDDWIMVSTFLTFSKMRKEQAGTYTCRAQHPTVPQLTQSRSIQLFVLASERSFTFDSMLSLSTPMLALAVALPAVLLLLVILVLAFIIPRHRAAAKKKAAQEESGQRTPIYKGSLESVPSVVGDTHPLVMG
uniref:Ig-like domain-containing protein n=1 Tax=Salvator merianae TaxID=96440 RepID=A0A8D0BGC4_SALMN